MEGKGRGGREGGKGVKDIDGWCPACAPKKMKQMEDAVRCRRLHDKR